MIFVDRVFCSLCLEPMGQLMGQPAEAVDLLADKSSAPHFCVCPDCKAAEIVEEVAA